MSILLQITFGGTNYSAGCVLNVVRLIDLFILLMATYKVGGRAKMAVIEIQNRN